MSEVGAPLLDDLQLALEVSDSAAELALRFFRTDVTTRWKGDGSPVTEADRAVEQLLIDALMRARPQDALLGEEQGAHGAASRCWVLDPIDGTRQFVDGNPNWRVQVALEVDGVGRVASVTSPALGLCWWAAEGHGAFEASWPCRQVRRRLVVSATGAVDTATIGVLGDEPIGWRVPTRSRLASSTVMPLVSLLRGDIDAVVAEGYYAWDHAPWVLLVQESGGRFTDRRGGTSSAGGGGLYSNVPVHDHLVKRLGYPGPRS